MSQHVPPPEGDRIIDEPLAEALSRRYLAYALSTITGRALPDVRDGLKPVQRRLLYAMNNMRLNPEGSARKCAKVVGEVMALNNGSSLYSRMGTTHMSTPSRRIRAGRVRSMRSSNHFCRCSAWSRSSPKGRRVSAAGEPEWRAPGVFGDVMGWAAAREGASRRVEQNSKLR